MLGCRVSTCLTVHIRNHQTIFQSGCTCLHFHQQMNESSGCSTSLSTLAIVCFFHCGHIPDSSIPHDKSLETNTIGRGLKMGTSSLCSCHEDVGSTPSPFESMGGLSDCFDQNKQKTDKSDIVSFPYISLQRLASSTSCLLECSLWGPDRHAMRHPKVACTEDRPHRGEACQPASPQLSLSPSPDM